MSVNRNSASGKVINFDYNCTDWCKWIVFLSNSWNNTSIEEKILIFNIVKHHEKLKYLILILLSPSLLNLYKKAFFGLLQINIVYTKQLPCLFKYSVTGAILTGVIKWIKIKSTFICLLVLQPSLQVLIWQKITIVMPVNARPFSSHIKC